MNLGKGVSKKQCFFSIPVERRDRLVRELAEVFDIVKISEGGERIMQMGPDLNAIYHSEVVK